MSKQSLVTHRDLFIESLMSCLALYDEGGNMKVAFSKDLSRVRPPISTWWINNVLPSLFDNGLHSIFREVYREFDGNIMLDVAVDIIIKDYKDLFLRYLFTDYLGYSDTYIVVGGQSNDMLADFDKLSSRRAELLASASLDNLDKFRLTHPKMLSDEKELLNKHREYIVNKIGLHIIANAPPSMWKDRVLSLRKRAELAYYRKLRGSQDGEPE